MHMQVFSTALSACTSLTHVSNVHDLAHALEQNQTGMLHTKSAVLCSTAQHSTEHNMCNHVAYGCTQAEPHLCLLDVPAYTTQA